ncbi:MAG: hypothetical protein AAF081_13335 [Actinomycetota bacterium]
MLRQRSGSWCQAVSIHLTENYVVARRPAGFDNFHRLESVEAQFKLGRSA